MYNTSNIKKMAKYHNREAYRIPGAFPIEIVTISFMLAESDGKVIEESLVTVMELFSSLTSSMEKVLLLGSQISICNSSLRPFRLDT